LPLLREFGQRCGVDGDVLHIELIDTPELGEARISASILPISFLNDEPGLNNP
jgi:hypothetical protein